MPTKPQRVHDRPCEWPGCPELVMRMSRYCRHHIGQLHGKASGGTYWCSAACQARHQRCGRCRVLCGGSHARKLREGVCYAPGVPNCWSALHGGAESLELWVAHCMLCTRSTTWLNGAPQPGTSCPSCGSRLLQAERTRVTAGLRTVAGRRDQAAASSIGRSKDVTLDAGVRSAVS